MHHNPHYSMPLNQQLSEIQLRHPTSASYMAAAEMNQNNNAASKYHQFASQHNKGRIDMVNPSVAF
jgi:hypothetical protein